ncbi:MAG: FAD-dependent oxidoreductase [Pseudomonadota bacterium]
MSESQKTTIAVIGAGLVGLSCALWLQKKGFQVSLIDPEKPGSVTSFGNACTIAEYGCVPINSPDIFKRLPGLLFSKDSPLSLDPLYAASHPRWMIQFLLNCRGHRVEYIIRHLSQLLNQARSGMEPLIEMCDAHHLIGQNGFMHVYRDDAEFAAAWPANLARRNQGVVFSELNAGEIQDLEPNLKYPFQRGLLFEGVKQVLDPQALSDRYTETFLQQQGHLIPQKAMQVDVSESQVRVQLGSGDSISTDQVVIAAGAFSTQIKGLQMASIPLDTERGYHVQYSDKQHLVSRPVSWQQAGFYATPTLRGLRFAGTVEIAGYSQRKNPRMIDYLTRLSKQMFDLPESPDQDWLGYRPTLPDALPVIGFSPHSKKLLFAFGHHHLGLTLSGVTGQWISELASGDAPGIDMTPFSAARFG